MKRIVIVCEGSTEQEFCKAVLAPKLLNRYEQIDAPVIKHSNGGIVPWSSLKRQIDVHLRDKECIVTMLVDYYGIKDNFRFPGWEESKSIIDKVERMHFLFQKMSEEFADSVRYRFIPYIQLHEFEALLFSDVSAFKKLFSDDEVNYNELESASNAFDNPEMINNSPRTAPSKRLINAVKGYEKVLCGCCIAIDIGLEKIREKCPLFNEWIENMMK